MITLTAKITLADVTIYDVNKRNILSIDTNIVDRSDISMPSPGIVSNRGKLQFVDYDGTINRLVETNELGENQRCEIYLSDTIAKTEYLVGEFYAVKWDYDSDNRKVTITLQDNLIEWQNIEMNAIGLSAPQTAYSVFLGISSFLGYYYPSKFSFSIDETTLNIMKNYTIQSPYFNKASIWNHLTQICIACGLHIFKTSRFKVIVSYDFRS